MQRSVLMAGTAVAAAVVLLWWLGGLEAVQRWAEAGQRDVQNAMAAALRGLRAGEAGALAGLLSVAFGYGFFHAVGPGHGKMVIGGYGLGRRVRLLPLAAIALVSSLAQATTAVALVYGGIFLLGWTRERMEGVTEQVLDPLGYAAVGGIGLWLVWRGWCGLARRTPVAHHHDHDHHHHHDHDHAENCGCGHKHAPDLAEVAALTGWRDAAVLIAGIAIRPCTGALFLLILTWRMQIGAVGILGAYAMALGTATVTLAVAGLTVWAREGALAALPGGQIARAVPVLELAGGVLVLLIAGPLLLHSL